MSTLDLRPMGIGDILDVTFRLYRARFVNFLLIALVAYVPFALVMAVLQASIATTAGEIIPQQPFTLDPEAPFAGGPAQAFPIDVGTAMIVFVVGILVFFCIIWPLCQGALVHSISAEYLGEHLGAWESYARAAPRVPRMLLAQFLAGLVIMVGFVLLIVPGVIFSLWFMLIAPVIMLEQVSISGALGRSRELMRGNLGKGFLLALVAGLLAGLINGVSSLAIGMVPWPHPFLSFFLQNAAAALVVPIQMAPIILLYYDLRIRKEGFDLQMLASDLGTMPVATPV